MRSEMNCIFSTYGDARIISTILVTKSGWVRPFGRRSWRQVNNIKINNIEINLRQEWNYGVIFSWHRIESKGGLLRRRQWKAVDFLNSKINIMFWRHVVMLFTESEHFIQVYYIMACRPVTRQRPVNSDRGIVFSARSAPMAAQAAIGPETEERCFLYGPFRDVLSRTISVTGCSWVSWLVIEIVRGLLRFSPCELLLLEAGNLVTVTIWETKGRGTSAVGSRYQKTGEDTAGWEGLSVCCSKLHNVI
jgi:hypothetical protein